MAFPEQTLWVLFAEFNTKVALVEIEIVPFKVTVPQPPLVEMV